MRRILAAIALAIGLGAAGATIAAPATAVIGGSDAITNPGAVSIYTDDPYRNRCTGALIHAEWILTAAHCYYSITQPQVNQIEVRIGSTDNTTGYVSRGLAANPYRFPADFDPDPDVLRSDIMLVKLDAPVLNVPIMRYNQVEPPIGTTYKLYGWGWTCETPGLTCSTWYAGPLQVTNQRTVADAQCGYPDVRSSCLTKLPNAAPSNACVGDSGAPEATKGFDGVFTVHHIVAGDGDDEVNSCAYGPNGTPGLTVATAIGPYRDWITSRIQNGVIGATTAPAVTSAQLQELLALTD